MAKSTKKQTKELNKGFEPNKMGFAVALLASVSLVLFALIATLS